MTSPSSPSSPLPTTLREQWAAGRATLGTWCTIPSTISAESSARVGFDFVCVDTQHGVIDYQMAAAMFQAIELGGQGRPLTRVPWNEPGIIGKMLDAGAEGVIVPMVNTREQAEAVVRACRYAPIGSRSHGPVMSSMRIDTPYWKTANDRVAVIPMIETVEAISNLDSILSVPGIDAIYVGPADLSLTLGLAPQNNDGEPAFDEALLTIANACKRHGVVAGIHATGGLCQRRLEQGYRLITVAGDLLNMRSALAAELATARNAEQPKASTAIY
jgi:4-hydroxy-2-oxoheptanedioate aldolase